MGSSTNSCSGSSAETDTCNDGLCPTWSNWSSWDGCSATCDGGTQSRTRNCQNGVTDDCPGLATDMQQCNQHSCEPKMVYWSETSGHSYGWRHVYENYLPLGETLMDRCVAYCMSYTGCIGAAVEEEYYYYQYWYGYEEYYEYCFITDRDFISPFFSNICKF